MKSRFSWFAFLLIPVLAQGAALVADHTCTDVSQIPDTWINAVKSNLRVHYAHTSHGSQLISGIEVLSGQDGRFAIDVGYQSLGTTPGTLRIFDGQETDTYITPELYWEAAGGRTLTRNVLNNNPTINVSMWAWCGQVSDYSMAQISNYLAQMTAFEAEFPNVKFIYMTGHLDGSGTGGALYRNNTIIRDFCNRNNKILFDFADIESYDPSGNEFMTRGANDNCDYNGGNWAAQWCGANPGSALCADCSCAHSQPLNCNLKGRALWWLLARIAGWGGSTSAPPVDVTKTPPQPVWGDYNGDGYYDLAIESLTLGRWYIRSVAAGSVLAYGMSWGGNGMIPVSGDYNGGGFDLAQYLQGKWYIRALGSSTAITYGRSWGGATMTPVPGDYDGDGNWDLAVYDRGAGMWYIRPAAGAGVIAYGVGWGASTMTPVSGDYDGDGRWDLAMYDSATGNWYIRSLYKARPLAWAMNWGFAGCVPVTGDFDGDGRFDLGVYHAASGRWYARRVVGGAITTGLQWGGATMTPVPGDYNADGRWDLGLYEKGAGRWYIRSVVGNKPIAFGTQWGW